MRTEIVNTRNSTLTRKNSGPDSEHVIYRACLTTSNAVERFKPGYIEGDNPETCYWMCATCLYFSVDWSSSEKFKQNVLPRRSFSPREPSMEAEKLRSKSSRKRRRFGISRMRSQARMSECFQKGLEEILWYYKGASPCSQIHVTASCLSKVPSRWRQQSNTTITCVVVLISFNKVIGWVRSMW